MRLPSHFAALVPLHELQTVRQSLLVREINLQRVGIHGVLLGNTASTVRTCFHPNLQLSRFLERMWQIEYEQETERDRTL